METSPAPTQERGRPTPSPSVPFMPDRIPSPPASGTEPPAANPEPPANREPPAGYGRYLVEHFKIDTTLADHITASACSAGSRFGFAPSLLLAIMAVESSYRPDAANGQSVGLMQVNAHAHADKIATIGGTRALRDIDKNVYVGAWVLRELRDRSRSMLEALARYSGAKTLATGYPQRVQAHQHALERAAPASTGCQS